MSCHSHVSVGFQKRNSDPGFKMKKLSRRDKIRVCRCGSLNIKVGKKKPILTDSEARNRDDGPNPRPGTWRSAVQQIAAGCCRLGSSEEDS
jgi:hypothetical protein